MKKASLLCSLLLLFACSSDSDTGGDSGAGETQKFTLLVAPNEGGTVSTAGGSYTKGTTVTITATPNPDYLFDRWTGSVNSQENPLELTINKNENIEANFIKKQYELAVNIEGEGTVDEKLLESAKSYDTGSQVELTAVPAEDWQFEQWIIDDEVITENPLELVIDKAMSVDVKFSLATLTNTGVIYLGDNLNPEDLTITTALGSYSVNPDGSFEVEIESEIENQTFFVENQNEEVLYASFINEGNINVNAESTVETIFGMMPWSWSLSRQEIDAILAEFRMLSEYEDLVIAVEQAVAQNESPLNNQNVLDTFERLVSNNAVEEAIETKIPEVDYNVEPTIEFDSGTGSFKINNDGITSAVWELKLKDYDTGTVFVEDIYLAPNQISLPSIASVWNYLTNPNASATSIIYNPAEPTPLNTGGSVEKAYRIEFKAPFKDNFIGVNTGALSENMNQLLLDLANFLPIGADGCIQILIRDLSPVFIEFGRKIYYDETTAGDAMSLIFEEMFQILNAQNCDSKAPYYKYFKGLGQFFEVTSKLNNSFQTVKRLIDIVNLSDIDVCRQIINGKAYPCSYLKDITEEKETSKVDGERILLKVDAKMFLAEEEDASPGSIKINWEKIEGDGELQSSQTSTGDIDGIADTYYTLGNSSNNKIRASIKNSSGEIIKIGGTEIKVDIEIKRSPIYLDSNGVTVKARDNAKIGETYNLPGTEDEYLIVDETKLRELVSNFTQSQNSNTDFNKIVTTKVTNMNSLFKDKEYFNEDISSWDTSNVWNMERMFMNAVRFDKDIGNWNTSRVSTMISMFENANYFNQPIGDWDVSNVGSMYRMFYEALGFNQPIGNWDTSNVTDMRGVFDNASEFNQPIGNWNTSNVTEMQGMFFEAESFNQPIGNWDTSNVTDMEYMFFKAVSFNQPIGNWKTSNVRNMKSMFEEASSFNQSIGSWNVSNVTNMYKMFEKASSFNQPIGSWDISSGPIISYMLRGTSFNQDVSSWDVSNVTDFIYLFSDTPFNQDISSWDISNVTSMTGMFSGSHFNQNVSGWDVSNVTRMDKMFWGTPFNQDISGWDVSSVTYMGGMLDCAHSFNQDLTSWPLPNYDISEGYESIGDGKGQKYDSDGFPVFDSNGNAVFEYWFPVPEAYKNSFSNSTLCYRDNDGDGAGNPNGPFERACSCPTGYVDNGADSNDSNPNEN